MPRDPIVVPPSGQAATPWPPPPGAPQDGGPAVFDPIAAPGEPSMPLFLFKELTKVFSQWI